MWVSYYSISERFVCGPRGYRTIISAAEKTEEEALKQLAIELFREGYIAPYEDLVAEKSYEDYVKVFGEELFYETWSPEMSEKEYNETFVELLPPLSLDELNDLVVFNGGYDTEGLEDIGCDSIHSISLNI